MRNYSYGKRWLLASAFALPLAAFGSKATADAILVPYLGYGTITIEDTDVEQVQRNGVTIDGSGSEMFQSGDIIRTILRFNTLSDSLHSQDDLSGVNVVPSLTYELLAYAELEIDTIEGVVTNSSGSPIGGDGLACASDYCWLTFKPSGNLGGDDVASGDVTFAEIYEYDSSPLTYNSSIAPQAAIDDIQTPGNLVATIGVGQTDDFWGAASLLDIANAADQTLADAQFAIGNFGLSFLQNPGNFPYDPLQMEGTDGNMHDIIGNASAYAIDPTSATNTGWLVSSNTTAAWQRSVPEPATLTLISLGLIAAGGVARRRRT
jgi:hypothetical protein